MIGQTRPPSHLRPHRWVICLFFSSNCATVHSGTIGLCLRTAYPKWEIIEMQKKSKNPKKTVSKEILKNIYGTRFLSRDPRVSKAYNVNSFLIDDLMFLAILLVQFDQIFQPATFRALLLNLLLEILVHLLHNLLKFHS